METNGLYGIKENGVKEKCYNFPAWEEYNEKRIEYEQSKTKENFKELEKAKNDFLVLMQLKDVALEKFREKERRRNFEKCFNGVTSAKELSGIKNVDRDFEWFDSFLAKFLKKK